jgi:hypothetical protein
MDATGPSGFSSQKQNSFSLSSLMKGDLSFAKIKTLAKEVLKNKTGRFFVGYAGVMLFLVSGIVIMSVADNKTQPKAQAVHLPSLTDFSPAVLTPTPTATSTAAVTLSTPTASPTATPDTTAGWKTYPNSIYGYSIKYPPTWTATDLGQLEPKVPSFVTLNPSGSSPSATLAITVSSSTRTYAENLALKSKTTTAVIISGVTASKTNEKDSDGNQSISIVIPGSTYTYILVAKKAYESNFNQIYPTFKLLP